MDGEIAGESGSILMPLGTLVDVFLTGMLSAISLTSLVSLKEAPLLVLRAETMLVSRGGRSSCTEGRLEPASRGSTFLGYYYLKDFFLVC